MSDEVKFDEEEVLVDRASQVSRRTALVNLIIRLKLAKNDTQANYVLVGIMIICLLATLFVISRYLI